jgi:hypothetical protein
LVEPSAINCTPISIQFLYALTFDTDRFENFLDVLGGRRGVATEGEEKVSCEVLHFDS